MAETISKLNHPNLLNAT
jgi:serine/threonine protein kinase